eukprot:TRINITY_DN2580_c2_g1_i1.p1 TRINITY_DN2580_c2_g1~~TRINITY_DN2580_c2_g1_i1.p1  ORF type:complete len:514 (+),score=138.43 TRINITY_DN2580_c2_g1_i1:24-1544(+)
MSSSLFLLLLLLPLLLSPVSSLPHPKEGEASGSASSRIDTVVVLMLENRSFDHMLGYLNTLNPEIDGLTGKESQLWNVQKPSEGKVTVKNTSPYISGMDPDHSTNSTTFKIYGNMEKMTNPAPMNGFANWEAYMRDEAFKGKDKAAPIVPLGEVINMFTPERVPVISALAQEFALFDQFHASVPGPTHPNRLFSMSATSAGSTTNDVPVGGFKQDTIFDRVLDAGLEWNIFFHDVSWALMLSTLRTSESMDRIQDWSFFLSRAKEGTLPHYSFLEPQCGPNPWTGVPASDQHPDHDVRAGERLIKETYEAIRASPKWNSTLLIVTYDEHGGFYDHVAPPAEGVPNPDGIHPYPYSPLFNFDRLGVRIPFIAVSPWIQKGHVEHKGKGPTPTSAYELSTIPAMVHKLLGTKSFLTKRDAWASTFEHLLEERSSPRTDCPMKLPEAPAVEAFGIEFQEEASQPMNDLQCDYLKFLTANTHTDCSMSQMEFGKMLPGLLQQKREEFAKN